MAARCFVASWLSLICLQGAGDAAAASAWLWTGGIACHMLQPNQDVFIYALGMGGASWHLTRQTEVLGRRAFED